MRLSVAGLIVMGVLGLGIESAAAAPKLGVALLSPDTVACATFLDPRKPGDLVYLFLLSPPRVVDGWIQARLSESCNAGANAEALSYVVRLRHPLSNTAEIGIALYDPSARVEYQAGEFIVSTVGATAPLQFRQCTSAEGVHLTAWRENRRTWHQYWYLGTDVEPTCTESEMK